MDPKAERRSMLCSEIINLHVQTGTGRNHELKANLEEIWPAGAILWTDIRIRQYTSLWFRGGDFDFRGRVNSEKLLTGLGYLVEMQFHPTCKWSEQRYRPKHLFNPLVLLANRVFETTLCAARSPFDGPRQSTLAPRQRNLTRIGAAAPLKAACGN
jgi:hypothetical protein